MVKMKANISAKQMPFLLVINIMYIYLYVGPNCIIKHIYIYIYIYIYVCAFVCVCV